MRTTRRHRARTTRGAPLNSVTRVPTCLARQESSGTPPRRSVTRETAPDLTRARWRRHTSLSASHHPRHVGRGAMPPRTHSAGADHSTCPARVTDSLNLRCALVVPLGHRVAVEHKILLASHAPRLEQIRTNPNRGPRASVTLRAWRGMTIRAANRSFSARIDPRANGPVRGSALVHSQEPGGVDATSSS